MNTVNLKSKSINALFWSALQAFSSQGISFIVSIILARILSPSDFGLVAMVMVFVVIGEAIINSGLSQSLIRNKEVSNSEYSSVLLFNITISIFIYSLFYIAAPFISDFYNQPLLKNIIRIYFLIFIIKSFSIVQNTILIKSLNFKSYFIITLPSVVLGGVSGILYAINGYGVWSLVYSAIIQSLAETFQYWLVSDWRPSGQFRFSNVKPHFKFGYKLTLSSFINAILSNFQSILIGKYFSPKLVGIFNRSNTFKQFPSELIVNIIGKVSQPIFAEIQDENEKLKEAYKKILQTAIFFVTPILVYIAFFAKPFFLFLLTDKWIDCVDFFRILCFTGIIYPIHVFNLHIINIKGRSDLNLKLEIIKGILTCVTFFISLKYGIYGLLYGSLFISCISIFINSYYSNIYINYPIYQQISDLSLFFIAPIITTAIAYLVDLCFFANTSYFYRLIISFTISSFLYISISFFTKPYVLTELFLLKKRRYDKCD